MYNHKLVTENTLSRSLNNFLPIYSIIFSTRTAFFSKQKDNCAIYKKKTLLLYKPTFGFSFYPNPKETLKQWLSTVGLQPTFGSQN